MAQLELQILNPIETVAYWLLRKMRSTAVAASVAQDESMTTSVNSPTVVKSRSQPIDPISGPQPYLPAAIARQIREKIKLITAPELTSARSRTSRLAALAASGHSQRQSMKVARSHTRKRESKPIAAAAPAPFSYRCTEVTAAKLALATVPLERSRGRNEALKGLLKSLRHLD
jgi:hypothetical protein